MCWAVVVREICGGVVVGHVWMSTLLNHQACLDVEACWYSTLLNRCFQHRCKTSIMATGVGHCGACSNYKTSLVFSFSFFNFHVWLQNDPFFFDFSIIRFFDCSIRQVHEK
jgi:hypothetical protein